METVTVKLRKEFILDEDPRFDSELLVNNTETNDSLYLDVDKDFIYVGIDSDASEEIKTRFTDFCDDIFFLTDSYKSTNYQIPTSVLFSRREPGCGLYMRLKTEFFNVEVM